MVVRSSVIPEELSLYRRVGEGYVLVIKFSHKVTCLGTLFESHSSHCLKIQVLRKIPGPKYC